MNEKFVKQWKAFIERLEDVKCQLSDYSGVLHKVSEDKNDTNAGAVDDLGAIASDNGVSIDDIAATLSDLSATLDDLAATVSELAEKANAETKA